MRKWITVTPAQAGVHFVALKNLDSDLRRNDENCFVAKTEIVLPK